MTVVALDVGGTLMKGAVVERDGTTHAAEQRPTPRQPHTVDGILAFATDLATAAGTPDAVGLAVPGIVDDTAGIARYSANLGWRDLPLRDIATTRLGLPVAVTHDVRAGAIAEHRFGAARDTDHFLFLPIGTGIAGTVVTHGTPYHGADGMAGEIGHAPVPIGDEPCACGQRGCLETYASAAAIARRYGNPALTAADIVTRAPTDPHAQHVLNDAITALSHALTTYTMLLDPTTIVIGGGLAEAGDTLITPLRTHLTQRMTWRQPPHLVRAQLGANAGRLGAAIRAWSLL